MKHLPQKCSFCKRKIYFEQTIEPKSDECTCDRRGDYYIQSNQQTDSSGREINSDFYEHNYLQTKTDQELYY